MAMMMLLLVIGPVLPLDMSTFSVDQYLVLKHLLHKLSVTVDQVLGMEPTCMQQISIMMGTKTLQLLLMVLEESLFTCLWVLLD